MLLVHNGLIRLTVTDHQEALLEEQRMHRLATEAGSACATERVVPQRRQRFARAMLASR